MQEQHDLELVQPQELVAHVVRFEPPTPALRHVVCVRHELVWLGVCGVGHDGQAQNKEGLRTVTHEHGNTTNSGCEHTIEGRVE